MPGAVRQTTLVRSVRSLCKGTQNTSREARGFGHASESPMHHEQYGRSMKAPETAAMLVERAQRLVRESRKLLEQREAQLRQQEQFLEQRATIAEKDTAIRATAQ